MRGRAEARQPAPDCAPRYLHTLSVLNRDESKMTATLIARIAILAALPLLFLHRLPSAAAVAAFACAGALMLWTQAPWLRIAAIALLLCAWMLGAARSAVTAIETASAAPA
ncbi:MAG TPA: hypothetical protein DCS81_13655, partial [Pantoea septica]|nr:hypothetical protein [Pantoea septica]